MRRDHDENFLLSNYSEKINQKNKVGQGNSYKYTNGQTSRFPSISRAEPFFCFWTFKQN